MNRLMLFRIYTTQCVNGEKDSDFLMFIYRRLENVHKESPCLDFMIRLKEISEEIRRVER